MYAISIKQPWAEFVIGRIRRIELRKKEAKYRGVLLIHTPKKNDLTDWESKCPNGATREIAKRYLTEQTIGRMGMRPEMELERIVGAVIMAGCDLVHNNSWCERGMWFYRFEETVRFGKPVKARGDWGVFNANVELKDLEEKDRKRLMQLEEICKEYRFDEGTEKE